METRLIKNGLTIIIDNFIIAHLLFIPQPCPDKTLCLRKSNKPCSVLSESQILKKICVSVIPDRRKWIFEYEKMTGISLMEYWLNFQIIPIPKARKSHFF